MSTKTPVKRVKMANTTSVAVATQPTTVAKSPSLFAALGYPVNISMENAESLNYLKVQSGFLDKIGLGTKVVLKDNFDDYPSSKDGKAFAYVVGYSVYELQPQEYYGFFTLVLENGEFLISIWASDILEIVGRPPLEEALLIDGLRDIYALWIKGVKTDSIPASHYLQYIVESKEVYQAAVKKIEEDLKAEKEAEEKTTKAAKMITDSDLVYFPKKKEKKPPTISFKLMKISKRNKETWNGWLMLKASLIEAFNL